MKQHRARERGGVDIKVVGIFLLSVLFLAAGSAAIWYYFQYTEAHTNVESKITEAEANAAREQKLSDEAEFAAREKEPLRTFASPDDYGRLTFDYPKTWSAYQDTDVSKGGGATYSAYLNPVYVPPVPTNALSDLIANTKVTPTSGVVYKFAVRLKIQQKLYDETLKEYEPLLKTGQITSSAYTNPNGIVGTRYDGRFNNDIRGTAIVIRMRDRTLTLRTDADVFKSDFEALAQTVKFNE